MSGFRVAKERRAFVKLIHENGGRVLDSIPAFKVGEPLFLRAV